jgi:hypothetical protein
MWLFKPPFLILSTRLYGNNNGAAQQFATA